MSLFTQFTNTGVNGRFTFISNSRTFTVPVSATYRVYVVGAGGSGGAINPGWALPSYATGGGAGGFAIKTAYFNAGTNLAITIGAGGAAFNVGGGYANGSAGGATNVAGGGINVTANGGGAGTVSWFNAGTFNGGAGGNASGGDFNFTSGAGGQCIVDGGAGGHAMSGGGAVAWNGTAFAGGVSRTFASYSGSGGAGIGGAGGTSYAANAQCCSGGGGAFGPGGDAQDNRFGGGEALRGRGLNGRNNNTLWTYQDVLNPSAWGSGQGGGQVDWGAGSGGISQGGTGGSVMGLGGSGGASEVSTSGTVFYGGGSGGGANGAGAGGSGFVILTWS